MSWEPTEKEIQQVIVADARHRYEYFIHRVCEAKAVWALFNDGWASVAGDNGEQLIPVWPHQVYAQTFATGAWAAFQPRRIALEDFLEEWIPGFERAALQPAVFPVPEGSSILVTAEDLDANLRHELSEVYGIED